MLILVLMKHCMLFFLLLCLIFRKTSYSMCSKHTSTQLGGPWKINMELAWHYDHIKFSFMVGTNHALNTNATWIQSWRIKRVIKLLNSGIIFPIFDRKWVSSVECVAKKYGMMLVVNENNELIPTRTVTCWRIYIDYRKLNNTISKSHYLPLYSPNVRESGWARLLLFS